ncbi:MAG TPA: calcium-binding protein [Tepidisphaeraceae bacterium]|nr:calcium-binding protein [Tepidisphaeraceae bacterium]
MPGKDLAHAALFSGDVMKAPRRSARSLFSPSLIEQLESRQMLAASLSGGVLTVDGGSGADNIRVNVSGTNIVVHLNATTRNFARSSVQQLVVNGNAGKDKINVTGPIPNVVLNGGSGNDQIFGSGGADLISGGDGKDTLRGRKGNDQIYGDGGDDELFGGNGNDTLGGDDEDMLTPIAGEVGNDVLNGGLGDDWLLSGQESDEDLDPLTAGIQPGITDPSGSDQLTGGAGIDVTDIRGRDGDGMEVGDGDTITDTTDTSNIIPVDDVTGDISGEGDYSHHKHAFLILKINGQSITIGNGAGQFFGQPVVHTHTAPTPLDVRGNLLHFHNTDSSGGAARVFTLGDFFEHWGISLSSKNIGRFRVDQKHTLTMTVKVKGEGTFITPAAGQNFNNYVIQTEDGAPDTQYDQIIIEYKTA